MKKLLFIKRYIAIVVLFCGVLGSLHSKRLLVVKHNKELDSAEYLRILEQGEKEDLRLLLDSVGEKLPMDVDDREVSFSVPETYELIVECKDEADQKSKFEKLKLEGYKLRILTL